MPPAAEAQSLNHWITREFPGTCIFKPMKWSIELQLAFFWFFYILHFSLFNHFKYTLTDTHNNYHSQFDNILSPQKEAPYPLAHPQSLVPYPRLKQPLIYFPSL